MSEENIVAVFRTRRSRVPEDVRLRRLLKCLGRYYGFECLGTVSGPDAWVGWAGDGTGWLKVVSACSPQLAMQFLLETARLPQDRLMVLPGGVKPPTLEASDQGRGAREKS
jgi:hypothetical protein